MIEKILSKFREIGNIQFSQFSKPLIAVEDAIKIVQEVAKEYGGGWIPCISGQMPENCRVCWITWKIDGYAEEVYRASCHNGCWFNLDTQEEVNVSEIVAWKYCEKPAPYQTRSTEEQKGEPHE